MSKNELKIYEWRGGTYQFRENAAPEDAVLVKPVKGKARPAPKNKVRKPAANKGVESGDNTAKRDTGDSAAATD